MHEAVSVGVARASSHPACFSWRPENRKCHTALPPEGGNLYFSNARAQAAAVSQTITDGVTATAPSENAVFDALALKENVIATSTSATYFRGDKTIQTLNTTAGREGSNLYFSNARDLRLFTLRP